MRILIIANPFAGRKKARFELLGLLEKHAAPADRIAVWWTQRAGHAEILASKGRRQGFERIIAAGGDGTLHEVVNGIWWEPDGASPVIGMIPFGTGCDYPRNFDLGRTLDDKLRTALWGAPIPVDAGLIRLRGLDGTIISRVFVSVLGIGFDANVVKTYKHQTSGKGTRLAYRLSILKEWFGMRSYVMSGDIDSRPLLVDAILFAAGLGQYYGHGIRITPHASTQSGQFQYVWCENLGGMESLILLYGAFFGKHLNSRYVQWCYGRKANLDARPPASIEADGELLGSTPMSLDVIPGAFCFAVRDSRLPAWV